MTNGPLSEFEISKITEIVAGRMGINMDAKTLRQVIDRVVDALPSERGNPSITGGTCETPARGTSSFERTTDTARINLNQPSASLNPRDGYDARVPMPATEMNASPRAIELNTPPQSRVENPSSGLYDRIEQTDRSRIIVAAFGKNRPGIVAALTNVLAENQCSIEDISQTIMQDFFSMIMVVNMAGSPVDFTTLRDKLIAAEAQYGMKVYVMHEDIFRYMHRI